MLNDFVGVGHEELADRQHALQDVVFVDHEDFVGVVGQALEAAQVAQYHFAGNIGTDAHQLEVHDGAHLVVGKRHGGLYFGAFVFIQ